MSKVAEKTHQSGVFHGLPWWWHLQELPLVMSNKPKTPLVSSWKGFGNASHFNRATLPSSSFQLQPPREQKCSGGRIEELMAIGVGSTTSSFFIFTSMACCKLLGYQRFLIVPLQATQVAKKAGVLIAPVYLEAQCQARLSSKALRLSISSSSAYQRGQ